MSVKDVIVKQYEYGCWARAKILEKARQLSDEQYFHEQPCGDCGFSSLHSVLVHMLRTDWMWQSLARNGTVDEPPSGEEGFATLADVEAAWREEDEALRAFLDRVSESDLAAVVDTMSPSGQPYTFVRWEMLQHMFLHGVQHRTEAAAILTGLGQSPGDLDFVFFLVDEE